MVLYPILQLDELPVLLYNENEHLLKQMIHLMVLPEEELNVLGLQHIVELVQMMKIRLKVIIRWSDIIRI